MTGTHSSTVETACKAPLRSRRQGADRMPPWPRFLLRSKAMDDGSRHPIPETEARQATEEHVGRYVLGISLGLVVIAFGIIYLLYFG